VRRRSCASAQSMSKCVNCQLYTIAQFQFIEDIVEMGFDGGLGNCKALGDLGVAKATRNMAYDLGLAAC
jgi:hypothetical protein